MNVISTISIKNSKSIIGVFTRHEGSDICNICYPLTKGAKSVNCGSTSRNIKDVKTVRPATNEEIKAWRNAEGVGKSARMKASSPEKVKGIQWIRVSLEMGDEIITSM